MNELVKGGVGGGGQGGEICVGEEENEREGSDEPARVCIRRNVRTSRVFGSVFQGKYDVVS